MPKDIVATLGQTKLFSGFDTSLLEKIATTISLKEISSGEMIFYEKDPAVAFFVVSTGKVKIYKSSQEGKEQILMIAGAGDSFAEAALFGEGIYPASAQALEKSEIIIFRRDKFLALVEKNPSIALSLIARMAELLHKLNRLVEELSLTDITTRLAHYLIDAIESDTQTIITLTEKKAVLAAQLGTIPETLSRSFAKLTKEGIIKVEGADIHILQMVRLKEVAGL